MAERESNTLARALNYFMDLGRWGKVVVHFEAGRVKHVETSETYRPINQRSLAAIVGSHPAVAAAIQAGETKEFVFARLRGGKLSLLAVETHHPVTEEDHASDTEQPRLLAGSPALSRRE